MTSEGRLVRLGRRSRPLLALAVVSVLLACEGGPPARDAFNAPAVREFDTAGGVHIDVIREGEGRAAEDGDRVELHYRLELTDGTEVDASRRGKPLTFLVGGHEVIDGMHPAVRGMKPGEQRTVTIPSKQGYGGRAVGKIPADATLVFHLEMVDVHPRM